MKNHYRFATWLSAAVARGHRPEGMQTRGTTARSTESPGHLRLPGREVPRVPGDPGREADRAPARCWSTTSFIPTSTSMPTNWSRDLHEAGHARQPRDGLSDIATPGRGRVAARASADQSQRLRARLWLPRARSFALHRVQSDRRVPQRRDPETSRFREPDPRISPDRTSLLDFRCVLGLQPVPYASAPVGLGSIQASS